MKNYKKGFAPLIFLAVVAVVAIGGGTYIYTQNKTLDTRVDTDIQTNTTVQNNTGISTTSKPTQVTPITTADLKTYSNTKFGFTFDYPNGFTGLREYPNGQECKQIEVDKGSYVNVVQVATMSNLSVSVVCRSLPDLKTSLALGSVTYGADIPDNANVKAITIAGHTANQYMFTNATGYTWYIVKIPLSNNSNYVEIAYTYGNSHRLNKGGYELNSSEWANILASFKETP